MTLIEIRNSIKYVQYTCHELRVHNFIKIWPLITGIHVSLMNFSVFFDKATDVSIMTSLDFWKTFLIFEVKLQLSTSAQNFIVIRSITTKTYYTGRGGIRKKNLQPHRERISIILTLKALGGGGGGFPLRL